MSPNPILIGIAGVGRRTGVTHCSIQMAARLAALGYNVCCVEMEHPFRRQVFETFHSEVRSRRLPGGFHLEGIDFFRNEDDLWLQVASGSYDYIMLDCGFLSREARAAHHPLPFYFQTDVQMLVSGASLWDFYDLNETLAFLLDHDLPVPPYIFINYADRSSMDEIRRSFTREELNTLHVTFVWNPFTPNPFTAHHELHPWQEVLPRLIKRKKRSHPHES